MNPRKAFEKAMKRFSTHLPLGDRFSSVRMEFLEQVTDAVEELSGLWEIDLDWQGKDIKVTVFLATSKKYFLIPVDNDDNAIDVARKVIKQMGVVK